MKIRAKVFWTLFGMSALVALVGALAVNRQQVAARIGATTEAENIARTLGLLLVGPNGFSGSEQEAIAKLHAEQGRDIVLVDTHQLILADAVPSDIGGQYTEDESDEVGATLRDGQVRTFVEISSDSPLPIKQIVVPMHGQSGHVTGAVILEYTPIYDELMKSTKTTSLQVVFGVALAMMISLLIASFMGRSIANPLRQLTDAATGFASGKTDLPMPAARKDEIGEVADAFKNMVQKRWQAEEELRHARDELEIRVTERTAELAKTNDALLVENAERQRATVSLMESQQRLALARASAHIGIWDWDVAANKLFWDAQMYKLYGIREQDFSGAYDAWQKGLHPEDRARGDAAIHAALDGTKDFHVEFRVVWPDGEVRQIEARAIVQRADNGSATRMIGVNWDITARKRLEGQLLQSQKMETVGKLAGGIAHEFNSILTAIIGQSELMLEDLPPESPLNRNATEINKAAGRAATLTRQLLAYGRKQLLQPEILDLNQVVSHMEGMFSHLMGGDVDTHVVAAPNLKTVVADAGQIEHVIMSMAINAREAMPNGGKLMLETANVSFDEQSVDRYPELKPGDYAMLAITDTGTGMSEKIKARMFEPFFSTKDIGQGTGLGLSTCYGIIKQSGGHISVYSEPARGTTFKIYLPQFEQSAKIPTENREPSGLPRGTETILLVEDDPALREMATTLLERLGYTVLAAANGVEALRLKHQRDIGHIDLLFTDVVMPHMSGKELADRVRALYPHTRILFTSAYTESAIVHQGVLDKGVTLLQKPFTPSALAGKIREVLDAKETTLVDTPDLRPKAPSEQRAMEIAVT